MGLRRIASVIGLRPERAEEYLRHHAAVWPEVQTAMHDCSIRNYSIYRWGDTLFSYFEYVGDDYEGDMEKMAADPKTQEWWALVKPLQEPLAERGDGEWWMEIAEICHIE